MLLDQGGGELFQAVSRHHSLADPCFAWIRHIAKTALLICRWTRINLGGSGLS